MSRAWSAERDDERSKKMRTSIIYITPEIATATLRQNTRNRAPRPSVVHQYASEMSNGLWRENGEPIIIGSDNVLIDGQHRLLAIIESGTTQKMIVVHDIDPEARHTVDGGLRRSPSDVMSIEGLQNGHRAGATLSALVSVVRGTRAVYGSIPRELLVGVYHEIEEELQNALNVTARARGASGIPWDRGYWTATFLVVNAAGGQRERDRLIDVMCGHEVSGGSFEDRALRRSRKINGIADACEKHASVQLMYQMATGRYCLPKTAEVISLLYAKKARPTTARMLEWKVKR